MLRYVCIAIIVLLTACQSDDRVREANPEESQPTAVRSFNPGSLVGHHYFMDEQHSYLGFKIKYFGYSPVRGRFDVFDGTLFYDPEYPAATSATVFIDVSSIHTGQERRDEDLLREDTWFDAVDHPYISFYSTEAIPYENGSFDLIGEITVKGISRMDTLSFDRPTDVSRDWAENEQVDFSGKMTIDRQEFEVFGGDFWSSVMENGLTQLSDEVEVEVDIHCRRADYQARYLTEDSTSMVKTILDRIRDGEEIDSIFNSLQDAEGLSSGQMTSIGRTLLAWQMYPEALSLFKKKKELFPENYSIHNDLGITRLLLNDTLLAKKEFEKVLIDEPENSKAHEYLRLIRRMVHE